MDDVEWPPDDVLLELGRIAWSAMELEDTVLTVSQAVIGCGPEVRKRPAGVQASEAVEVLKTWPQTDRCRAGQRWLSTAVDALSGRHSVLHATVVRMAMSTADGDVHIDPAFWLHHTPARGRPGMPFALDSSELRAVREILVEARRSWEDVMVSLHIIRGERWAAGQIDRSALTPKHRRHG